MNTNIYIRTKVTDPETMRCLMEALAEVVNIVDEDHSLFAVPVDSPMVVSESFDVSVQRSLDIVKED